jgi:catechol 2,3-dioxygenase-like lactoylglutathione lyase family enzyme
VPTATGFNHVATLTPDLGRLVEFYARAFGAEVTFEMEATPDHPRMVVLDLGGAAGLNVFEVPHGDIIGDRRRQGGRGAIDH